jgi:hypothetical protein
MEGIYQYRTYKNNHQQPRTNGRTLVDNRKLYQRVSLNNSNQPAQLGRRLKKEDGHEKALNYILKNKQKLSHKRSSTAYGYFNLAGKRNQGPHRISHVTTSLMIEVMRKRGLSMTKLLGTKIIPRPRVNNKLLMEGFNRSSSQAKTKKWRQNKKKYLTLYNRLYNKALNGDKNAIEKLIELNALQTYKWSEGTVSSDEIKGKGERQKGAAEDLLRFGKMKKGDKISKKAKTIDTSGMNKKEQLKQSDRARQYGKAIMDDDLSDADEYGSESDSDVEMDN